MFILNYFRSIRSRLFYKYFYKNIVSGFIIVKVKNIPGKFKFNIKSHILHRILIEKEYEPELTKEIISNLNPNLDAINVGANVGLFSILLANNISKDKQVLCIEPIDSNLKLLNENIIINQVKDKIIVYDGIASNILGTFEINTIIDNEEYSSLGEIDYRNIDTKDIIKMEVYGETVDNLVRKYNLAPGILVIDTEGSELNVLLGAINILKEYKPVIISEICDDYLKSQNSSSKEIFELLYSFGYEIKFYPINSRIQNNNIFNGNIIAKKTL